VLHKANGDLRVCVCVCACPHMCSACKPKYTQLRHWCAELSIAAQTAHFVVLVRRLNEAKIVLFAIARDRQTQ
jgi:hypothetical protein